MSGSKVEYAGAHVDLLTRVVYNTSYEVVTKSVAYQYHALGRRPGESVDGNGTVDRWNPVTGATGYDLIFRNQVTLIESRILRIAGTSWTSPTDLAKGPYEWWVRASGTNGVTSLWSPTGSFEVGRRPTILSAIGTNNEDSRVHGPASLVPAASRFRSTASMMWLNPESYEQLLRPHRQHSHHLRSPPAAIASGSRQSVPP